MEVVRGLGIVHVQFNKGTAQIVVCPLLLDASDQHIVNQGGSEAVNTSQESLAARAVKNGRMDGQWGDQEIEEELRAATRIERSVSKAKRTVTTTTEIEGKDPVVDTQVVDAEQPVEIPVVRYPDIVSVQWL